MRYSFDTLLSWLHFYIGLDTIRNEVVTLALQKSTRGDLNRLFSGSHVLFVILFSCEGWSLVKNQMLLLESRVFHLFPLVDGTLEMLTRGLMVHFSLALETSSVPSTIRAAKKSSISRKLFKIQEV